MSQLNVREATITQKSGFVYVEREGERVTLEVGDAIYESDLIVTGPNTTAEVQYVDGTTSRLAPDTQMRLVDFEFDASMNGENSFLVDIAEGAMRTVTGEIVKLNPDAFKVTTPRATVGIRGTDIATQINSDGSETHVVISIGKGHRVEITTHDGQLMSLYTSKEGVFIPVDLGGDIKPYIFNFTQEEIDNIIEHIQGALADENALEDDEIGNEDTHAAVIIDQSTVDILGSEVIETLTNTLESSGLEVLLPENVVLETEDEDVILVPGEPDVESEYTLVDFNGQGSYYADGNDITYNPGQIFTASKTQINITQNITDQNTVISGDVNNIYSGIVQAADDIITGSGMENGRVVGDATDVFSGAELIAGDDQITFDSKTGGTSIFGDAVTVNAGSTVTFGDDTIVIKGLFANSVIAGDANVAAPSAVQAWGNDLITVGSLESTNGAGTFLYGDDTDASSASGGNDTILVLGTMANGVNTVEIVAGGGSDLIEIKDLQSGTIDAGAGADVINITTAAGGTIATSAGNDTINIENHTGSLTVQNHSISGSGGSFAGGTDTLVFENGITSTLSLDKDASGGFVLQNGDGSKIDIKSGGAILTNQSSTLDIGEISIGGQLTASTDLDTINVDTLNGGMITAYDGDDIISVTNFISGTINAGDILGTAVDADSITVNTLNANTIVKGGAGDDTLTITESGSYNLSTLQVSEIENFVFADGGNTIEGDYLTYSSISTGNGADSVHIETFYAGANDFTLDTGNADDTITIESSSTAMNGGLRKIYSGTGDDSISIGFNNFSSDDGISSGIVDGGSGDDIIKINSINAGNALTITAGSGADSITIEKIARWESNSIITIDFGANGVADTNLDIVTIKALEQVNLSGTIQKDIDIKIIGADASDQFIFAGTTYTVGSLTHGSVLDDTANGTTLTINF